jgi:hypothetical protein
LWDVAHAKTVAKFLHDGVVCVAFSPDGETLASGTAGYDTQGTPLGEIKLWHYSSRLAL